MIFYISTNLKWYTSVSLFNLLQDATQTKPAYPIADSAENVSLFEFR